MFDSERTRYAQLERDARHLAESISRVMREEGEELGEVGKEKLEHVKAQARHMYDRTKDTVEEKVFEIDDLAHEHVWKTAAISAAIGAVIGSIIFRHRR
ncbi:MAG: DUF883 C-terminal domain-containing protein [Candidatus Andersenbacteria bacterium]